MLLAEANQLRVMPVAPGRTLENRPCQERLTPERDQPDRIEVSGINGPETHARLAPRSPLAI